MGCNPHSNPRDVGKFPKEMLDLKLDTPHFSKKNKAIQRISGITGKIIREMLNANQAFQLKMSQG